MNSCCSGTGVQDPISSRGGNIYIDDIPPNWTKVLIRWPPVYQRNGWRNVASSARCLYMVAQLYSGS